MKVLKKIIYALIMTSLVLCIPIAVLSKGFQDWSLILKWLDIANDKLILDFMG